MAEPAQTHSTACAAIIAPARGQHRPRAVANSVPGQSIKTIIPNEFG